MADAAKILGQQDPAAGALTDLYTVPAVTQTIGTSIVVCNRNAVEARYRIAVAVAGAADAVQQYLAFDRKVPANDSAEFTFPYTLATTDKVRCRSDIGGVSFNAFGVEIT